MQNPNMQEKKRGFPWGWVLGGCALAVLCIIIAVVGVGYYAFRQVEEFSEEIKDPQKREEKVLEILGTDTLPDGLYPAFGFSVFWGVLEIAILGDQPVDAEGELPRSLDRGFIYFSVFSMDEHRQELEDFFDGKRDDAELLRQQNMDFDLHEVIGRGEIEGDDGQITRWVANRGEMEQEHGANKPSLVTLMMVECPDDNRMRLGIWFAPDPNQDAPLAELDLSGTNVEEPQISRFISHFNLCD